MLNPFGNRRTCLICRQSLDKLNIENSEDWSIVDFDAFCDNYNLWNDGDLDISQFFSKKKIKVIKQHLANVRDIKVLVVGEKLKDEDIFNSIQSNYIKFGYHIIERNGDKINYILNTNSNKLYLNMKVSNGENK